VNSRIWQTVTEPRGGNGKSDIEAIGIFCVFSELCIAYSREGMKVLFLLITSCHRIINH